MPSDLSSNKTNQTTEEGSGTIHLKGISTEGEEFDYSASIEFLGKGFAIVILSKSSSIFTVNLTNGGLSQ